MSCSILEITQVIDSRKRCVATIARCW